jgi:enterochelin esterase-like enzyme
MYPPHNLKAADVRLSYQKPRSQARLKQPAYYPMPTNRGDSSAREPVAHWLGRLLSTILFLALAACTSRAEVQIPEFTSLGAFIDTLEAVAGSGRRSDVNAFWNSLLANEEVPFVQGDRVAFLYRGKAQSVSWVGDFTDWQKGPALPGRRVGKSDIWVAYATFPTNARLEYRIVVDGQEGVPDPANPLQQWGGFGPNSVLAMPDYVFPQEVFPREDVPPGSLSPPLAIDSTHLGYTITYRVYTPAGYEELTALPVMYVTDGHEYTDPRMGSMPTVLDNLITAGTIEPMLAIFIDPRDPETGRNRREDEFLGNPAYAAFIAEELVPAIDRSYATDPRPERRAILGASYGGINSAYCGLTYPEIFHLVAMQSPAFVDDGIYQGYQSVDRLPLKIFLSSGYPWDFDARTMKGILEDKGYPLVYMEVPEGHSWGQWRSQLNDLLVYLFQPER